MLKSEIKVGSVYTARVGENICDVKVNEVIDRRGRTGFACTNLRTGKAITIKSAQKFRGEVKPKTEEATPVPMKNGGRLQSGAMTAPQVDVGKTLNNLPEKSELRKVVMDGIIGIATGKETAETVMAKVEKITPTPKLVTPIEVDKNGKVEHGQHRAQAAIDQTKKPVVATIHAGGGIYVDIVGTPADFLLSPKNRKGEPLPDPKTLPKKGEATPEYRAYLLFNGYQGEWIDKYFQTLNGIKLTVPQPSRLRGRDIGTIAPETIVTIVEGPRCQAEVLEQFPGSSTKVRVIETGKIETWAPATKVRVLTKEETQKATIPQPSSPTGSPAQATNLGTKPTPKPQTPKPNVTLTESSPMGIAVTKTDAGRVTVFGIGICAIFRWVGHKGFGSAELDVLRKALGIDGVGQASVTLELNAGKKGTKIPPLTPEQETLLMTAMDKGRPSPTPTKKKR